MLLMIQRLCIGVEIRQHRRRIRDWLAILIWMVEVDIVVEELRRLNGLLRLLRLLLQIRRVGTVMWRWIAHRPGTQTIHIESLLLRTVMSRPLLVSSTSSIDVVFVPCPKIGIGSEKPPGDRAIIT